MHASKWGPIALTVIGASMMLAGCGVSAPHPVPTLTGTETQTPDPQSNIVDSGVREGAMGSIELNSNGTPWRYTVVEGDYADAVCSRFNLSSDQLVFDSDGSPVGFHIQPEDVIRFVPSNTVSLP